MAEKGLQFVSRLTSYNIKSFIIRILSVSIVCVFFLFLVINVLGGDYREMTLWFYLKVIATFNIISEANVLLDNIAEKYYPIPERIGKRLLLHIFLSVLLIVAAFLYFQRLLHYDNLMHEAGARLFMALGTLFLAGLIISAIALRITEKWIGSRNELEVLKQEKLMSDYNSLQDQLNPHFLFNNLSVLKSMIIYDPKAAAVFIQNFTDVYRYVLQSKENTTVKLSDELEFAKAYVSLHKERLGQNLQVSFNIDESDLDKQIPPLSLQLLIENAIKHNIASKESPLEIVILVGKYNISVENNYQPKESSYSTRSGLKNLVKRYGILSKEKVSIQQNNGKFRVELPFL